jgi:hypothetical protein
MSPTMETLATDLCQFTGTETWYRHSMYRNVLYTAGVQYLAEKAGAYWLIDIIAIAQRMKPRVRAEGFQVWCLTAMGALSIASVFPLRISPSIP